MRATSRAPRMMPGIKPAAKEEPEKEVLWLGFSENGSGAVVVADAAVLVVDGAEAEDWEAVEVEEGMAEEERVMVVAEVTE